MKKLSTLIALVLIATIGGVYATWNYAGTNTNIGIYENQTITLENAVQDGAAGTFTLEHNIKSINIAPDDQLTKNAVIVPTYTSTSDTKPSLTLTFTPATNAGDVIERDALAAYVYFGTERSFTWNGKAVFTFAVNSTKPIKIDTADKTASQYHWEKQGSSFVCKIEFADISNIVALNVDNPISLPTIDDYNQFQQEVFLNGHTLQLHMHLTNINPAA